MLLRSYCFSWVVFQTFFFEWDARNFFYTRISHSGFILSYIFRSCFESPRAQHTSQGLSQIHIECYFWERASVEYFCPRLVWLKPLVFCDVIPRDNYVGHLPLSNLRAEEVTTSLTALLRLLPTKSTFNHVMENKSIYLCVTIQKCYFQKVSL